MTEPEPGAVFRLENMLIKNLSLEIPENIVAPTFTKEKEPNLQMELRNHSRPLSNSSYNEVILEATVRVKSGDDLQILIEVTQSGIFYVKEEDTEKRQLLLGVLSPEILYPYVSQIIADLLNKAGAPKIFLPPFNFKAIYEKKRQSMLEKLQKDEVPSKNA